MLALLILTPLAFGVADYFAGRMSTRVNPWGVVGTTCAVSTVGSLIATLLYRDVDLEPEVLLLGALAGVLLMAGQALLYSALARGSGGVVGAIVSLSVIVPVVSDALRGKLPSWPTLLGILAIVVGAIVISQPGSARQVSRSVLLLAGGAALMLGLQYLALGRGSHISSAAAVTGQFAAATLIVLVMGLVTRSWGGITRRDAPQLLGIGIAFLVGSLAFSAALDLVNVAIASAFLNTEPLVLALCGYLFLKEKLTVSQQVALFVVVAGAVTAVCFRG
ncbi:MAG: DMT family transporter [Candidatus Nanopelagicales bacterium]